MSIEQHIADMEERIGYWKFNEAEKRFYLSQEWKGDRALWERGHDEQDIRDRVFALAALSPEYEAAALILAANPEDFAGAFEAVA